jgi:hypothetical protein
MGRVPVLLVLLALVGPLLASDGDKKLRYRGELVDFSEERAYVLVVSIPSHLPLTRLNASADTCEALSPHLIVYNRVPKCASSSMLALLEQLEGDGELSWVHSKDFANRAWWSDEEVRWMLPHKRFSIPLHEIGLLLGRGQGCGAV